MSASETAGSAGDDAEFVRLMTDHMTQPCRTDAGNIRQFYISEAEKVLREGKITDALQRDLLVSAVQMAKIFKELD